MNTKPIALVIEDDEDQNIIFSTALERAGYLVKPVYNGKVAQQLLTELVPAVIVLDLHMPGVNGDVVLKQIRSDSRLKNARVIVTTADAAFAASLQFQAELILLKPVSFSQLSQLAARFTAESEGPTKKT